MGQRQLAVGNKQWAVGNKQWVLCKPSTVNCIYGICKQSHLIAEHGAGFDFIFYDSKSTIMNSNLILKSDILDIVFENRNKAYGAYDLRKFYNNRIKMALGIMLIIAFGFSAFTLLDKTQTLIRTIPYVFDDPGFVKPPEEPKTPEKKPEVKNQEAVPEKKVAPNKQQQFTNNVAVVPNSEKTDTIKTLLADNKISNVNIETPGSAPPVVKPANTETGPGALDVTSIPKIDINNPLEADAVDVLPAYPGGMEALARFLKKNLQTPDELQNDETVSVRIKFVVGYNGKLQRFIAEQDGREIYNKEVIRVLKKMPDWIPGKAKGENVSVYFAIPVKFVMSD